jgi:hypothetical protein
MSLRNSPTQVKFRARQLVTLIFLLPGALAVNAQHDQLPFMQKVNIFGDGNPANGTEDSRIDMSSPDWNSEPNRPWNMGAGTIHCDGSNRGSAVIIDTSDYGDLGDGMIVATSAHVLFDLDKRQRYSSCSFHLMSLEHIPGYQAEIVFSQSRIGGFDPASSRTDGNFGRHDWAFLYTRAVSRVLPSAQIKLKPFRANPIRSDGAPAYRFISFSSSRNAITISTQCQVRESVPGDIGGGIWQGQLLDDCDSEGGASGGGIIDASNGSFFLVGIRSGSHWDGDAYPLSEYPGGPPDGSRWDVSSNTNFGRAIDEGLMEILQKQVSEILLTQNQLEL